MADDLGPDPVAGDGDDRVGRAAGAAASRGERAVGHGSSSAVPGATNAELTLPISAPWSLLIATR